MLFIESRKQHSETERERERVHFINTLAEMAEPNIDI